LKSTAAAHHIIAASNFDGNFTLDQNWKKGYQGIEEIKPLALQAHSL